MTTTIKLEYGDFHVECTSDDVFVVQLVKTAIDTIIQDIIKNQRTQKQHAYGNKTRYYVLEAIKIKSVIIDKKGAYNRARIQHHLQCTASMARRVKETLDHLSDDELDELRSHIPQNGGE